MDSNFVKPLYRAYGAQRWKLYGLLFSKLASLAYLTRRPAPPSPTFRPRLLWRTVHPKATMEKLARIIESIGERCWVQTSEFPPAAAARAACGWRRQGGNSKNLKRYLPKACKGKPQSSVFIPRVVGRKPPSFSLLEVEKVGSCKVQVPLRHRRWCRKQQPAQLRWPRCRFYHFPTSISNTLRRSAGPEDASNAEQIYCMPFKWPTYLGEPFRTPRACQ